jgi:hypothetical protein
MKGISYRDKSMDKESIPIRMEMFLKGSGSMVR